MRMKGIGECRRLSLGFTLLEVLLVLFLMMILVFQAAPRFNSSEVVTRLKVDSANRTRLEGAIELYKLDTGRLPQTMEDLLVHPQTVSGWRGPYLDQNLTNPLKGGKPYEISPQGKVITP